MNKSKFSLFKITEKDLYEAYLYWVDTLSDARYEFFFGKK